MNDCPTCGRKLLSHISASCNWCGAEIHDADYLARADVERATLQAEQAQHDWQSFTIMRGAGVLSPRYPVAAPPPDREATPILPDEEPVDGTQARFGYLEI